MARMALVRGREVRTPRPLQRAGIRPPEEERPAPVGSPQPPAIPDQPPLAVTDEKAEGLQKKAEAAGIEEKAGAVETEEVIEPEDVSKEEELPPTVTGISFWNRFDQGIIGLLAIILMVVCYADARSLLGKPFTGFQLLKNRSVSGGLRSGMKPLDVIVAVEGKEVTSSAEIKEIVREAPLGTELNYTVLRKGGTVSVPVKTRVFSPHGFFWTIVINFAVGIGYLLIGMITFVKQHTEKNRWVFLILCITVFTLRITTFDFYSSHRFTWLIFLPYYVSIILFIILIAVFYNPTEGVTIFVRSLMGYDVLAFVILLISLAHSALRSSSPINRMRAKVVFLGFCGGLVPLFSHLISYLFRVNLGVFIVMSWTFSLLFPLTLGYAMIRHRLFGEGSEAPTAGTYKCSSCGNEIILKKSQEIPVCEACGAGGTNILWYRVVWTIIGV
jgi:hypothetical protein